MTAQAHRLAAAAPGRSAVRRRVAPAIAAVLGAAMVGSGTVKFFPAVQATMVAEFGLPGWFCVLVGTFEMIGGLLLAFPPTSPAGSFVLSTIMVGALWAHLAHREWAHVPVVLLLLMLFLAVFYSNRGRVVRFLERI